MDRRRFLLTSLAGALAAPPLAAGAQQGRMWRIAWLAEERDPGRDSDAPGGGRWFFKALRGHGYVEGRNLMIDFRFAEEKADQLSELAAAVVRNRSTSLQCLERARPWRRNARRPRFRSLLCSSVTRWERHRPQPICAQVRRR